MKIKVRESKKQEAGTKAINLKIEGHRVTGLTYDMVKACVESDDISVYLADTGPFGEDEGAEIISCDVTDAEGEMDLGGGDTSTADDASCLIVVDREIGQSGLNWADYYEANEDEYTYILAGDLPGAASLWVAKKLI